MARIRTIKPAYWQSEQIARLDLRARLLLIGLISNADDHGRLRGATPLVRATVFPYDDIPLADLDAWIAHLEAEHLIVRYVVDGSTYIALPSWARHQKVDHPRNSDCPEPPHDPAPHHDSREFRETLASGSREASETLAPDKEEEEEGERTTRARIDDDPDDQADTVTTRVETVEDVVGTVRLSPHQLQRARLVAAEHGIDVVRRLVERATTARGVRNPAALLSRFLAPESNELVDAVAEQKRIALVNAEADELISLVRAGGTR